MNDINPAILEILGLEDKQLLELTDKQKTALRGQFTFNLSCLGVFWIKDYGILFTNESTYKNWLYYAGFEYIKEFDLIKVGGEFVAFFEIEHDRVGELEEIFN